MELSVPLFETYVMEDTGRVLFKLKAEEKKCLFSFPLTECLEVAFKRTNSVVCFQKELHVRTGSQGIFLRFMRGLCAWHRVLFTDTNCLLLRDATITRSVSTSRAHFDLLRGKLFILKSLLQVIARSSKPSKGLRREDSLSAQMKDFIHFFQHFMHKKSSRYKGTMWVPLHEVCTFYSWIHKWPV